MNVEIKDRKKEIEYLRLSLGMVEIGMDYELVDLVMRTQKEVAKLGDSFSIDDAVHLRADWKREWDEYHESKNKKEEEK